MKTDDEEEMYELSPLGLQYRAELPRILRMSVNDLEGALEALDRYLEQAPPRAFQKALLAWKGLFYLEHKRYDDAIRELRTADALHFTSDLQSFNAKSSLAKALENKGDPLEAFMLLTKALNEIETPSLQFDLLPDLARLSSSTGQALPERAQIVFDQEKQFYGIDVQHAADLPAEILRVADLVHNAAVQFDHLEFVLKHVESLPEKVRQIEAYIQDVRVPYFKGLAENLLRRVRQEAEAKN